MGMAQLLHHQQNDAQGVRSVCRSVIDPIRLWHKVAWFVFTDGLLGLCVRVWFKTIRSIASWDCRFFMRDGSQGVKPMGDDPMALLGLEGALKHYYYYYYYYYY
jgi:hypothetical protein